MTTSLSSTSLPRIWAGLERLPRGLALLRRAPAAVLSATVLGVLVLAALAPWAFTSVDPNAVDMKAVLQGPSWAHLMGTDEAGRDILARIIHGAGPTLSLGFGAVAIGLGLGTLLGLTAAVVRGWTEKIILRLADVGLAFPELLLALLVIAVIGPGATSAMVAIGLGTVPNYTRLIRAQAIGVAQADYITAAKALGLSPRRILVSHILPNAIRPVIVLATIGLGTCTLAGAGLNFLGLGVAPPEAEWGSMLSTARGFLSRAWWFGTFPGLAIIALVIAATVFGRSLRRVLGG